MWESQLSTGCKACMRELALAVDLYKIDRGCNTSLVEDSCGCEGSRPCLVVDCRFVGGNWGGCTLVIDWKRETVKRTKDISVRDGRGRVCKAIELHG